MTVSELRNLLADLDGNMPILFAGQPSWPMEYDLGHDLAVVDGAVYLAEGAQLGYLASGVAGELGWN